jgi:methionyl aminopeptidase
MIDLKSPAEIEIMYEGGQMLSEIAAELKQMVSSGVTTFDIDKKARELFKKKNMRPAFLNFGEPPFPATICTSINKEIVHGIPSKDKVLEPGDIISIDLGGVWKDFCTDMAFTVGVGEIGSKQQDLIDVTRKALEIGISKMYTSNKLYTISWAIQQVAEDAGYSVVRDLVGHGIGRKLHEPPQVPNFGRKDTGMKLQAGMVMALEPMFNVGSYEIDIEDDDWTIVTADGELSCHFEHTVAITEKGPRQLTVLDD